MVGTIVQRLPGAAARVQRSRGLFPGRLSWLHDVERQEPWLVTAERTARIPIPDRRLPIIKTLTQVYGLRFGQPEAFAAPSKR